MPRQLTEAAPVSPTNARQRPQNGLCVRTKRIRKTGAIQAATGTIHRPLDTR